jgi:hypothetical protein
MTKQLSLDNEEFVRQLRHTICSKTLNEAYGAYKLGRYFAAERCIEQFVKVSKGMRFYALEGKAVVLKSMISMAK